MPLRPPPLGIASVFRSGWAASELQTRGGGIERDAERGESWDRWVGGGARVCAVCARTAGLSLTPEGVDYLPYVSEALSLIAIPPLAHPARTASHPPR
jgi:hypothetical protein